MRDNLKIERITFKQTNCYLLRGEKGTILVDAGPTREVPLIDAILHHGVQPHDLVLIVITHGHYDHYAAANRVSEWSGAPIGAHPDAMIFSQNRRNAFPPGQTIRGTIVRWLYLFFSPFFPYSPLHTDIEFREGDNLSQYGVDAHTINLPGHSPDSIGIITSNGDALVGDLFVNYSVPSQPLYMMNREAWHSSYRKILSIKPRKVLIGHGDPFSHELENIYPPRYQFKWWVR